MKNTKVETQNIVVKDWRDLAEIINNNADACIALEEAVCKLMRRQKRCQFGLLALAGLGMYTFYKMDNYILNLEARIRDLNARLEEFDKKE